MELGRLDMAYCAGICRDRRAHDRAAGFYMVRAGGACGIDTRVLRLSSRGTDRSILCYINYWSAYA